MIFFGNFFQNVKMCKVRNLHLFIRLLPIQCVGEIWFFCNPNKFQPDFPLYKMDNGVALDLNRTSYSYVF